MDVFVFLPKHVLCSCVDGWMDGWITSYPYGTKPRHTWSSFFLREWAWCVCVCVCVCVLVWTENHLKKKTRVIASCAIRATLCEDSALSRALTWICTYPVVFNNQVFRSIYFYHRFSPPPLKVSSGRFFFITGSLFSLGRCCFFVYLYWLKIQIFI